jgi:hypothetical protein
MQDSVGIRNALNKPLITLSTYPREKIYSGEYAPEQTLISIYISSYRHKFISA